MTLTERTIIFEVSVRCFLQMKSVTKIMMRWISLINKLFSDINISQGKCSDVFEVWWDI